MGVDRRQVLRRALPDIVAGFIFIAFGSFFALGALDYDLGTFFRMGPGLFPLLLGLSLVLIGAIVVGSGFVGDEDERTIGALPWRGIVLIPAAFVFFGLTVRGLGVVPAVFAATLLAGLASTRIQPLMAALIAAGLTVTSVVVFIVALQLRLPLIGPWLRF